MNTGSFSPVLSDLLEEGKEALKQLESEKEHERRAAAKILEFVLDEGIPLAIDLERKLADASQAVIQALASSALSGVYEELLERIEEEKKASPPSTAEE